MMKPRTKSDWLVLGWSCLPGPAIGFGLAFDPGTCNPHFNDRTFQSLIIFGTISALGMLFCLYKALQFSDDGGSDSYRK